MQMTQLQSWDDSQGDVSGVADSLSRHSVINRFSFLQPLRLDGPLSWAGHVPFVFFLVSVLRPKTIVELGAHYGVSYFALCQIVDHLGLSTKCYAIDTWRGDKHAGRYANDVYVSVQHHNEQHYSRFSRLIRSTFDEALPHFEEASIGLLHIDGLHTYDAVRHDFESWRPKLARDAIVLFHDTNVRELDFGVHRLWAEVAPHYPSFEFWHSHGLGVLGVGDMLSDPISRFFSALQNDMVAQEARMAYTVLGSALESRALQLRPAPMPRKRSAVARLKKKVRRFIRGGRTESC